MNIIEIFIFSFVFGMLSNEIGGVIGFIGKSNRESINKTVAFTAGITTSIICFELLIEAFGIAIQKNPDIELEIIGDGLDRSRLETLIEKGFIISGYVASFDELKSLDFKDKNGNVINVKLSMEQKD